MNLDSTDPADKLGGLEAELVNGPMNPLGERITMNWRSPVVLSVVVFVIVLLGAGGGYFGLTGQPAVFPTSTTPTVQPKPRSIIFGPRNAVTPTAITTLPAQPNASLFKNPNEPAYVPDKGFTPDAQRILDITSLQISLEQYRVTKGRYPTSLPDLFPDFAPKNENDRPLSAQPVDPVTKQPYVYSVPSEGLSYQLSAILSSGKQYTINGQAR